METADLSADRLGQVPIFDQLDRQALELIAARSSLVRFERGEEVLSEGQANDRLLCILSGRLRVSRSGNPTDVVLSEIGPGAILGELTFIDPGPAAATATTLEEVEAATLSAKDFAEVVEEHPEVALALVGRLALTLKERLAEVTTLLAAQKGIQESLGEMDELRVSLGQLV